MKYSLRSLMLAAANRGDELVYWFMDEWVPFLLRGGCLVLLVWSTVASLRYYRQGRKEYALVTCVAGAVALATFIVSLIAMP